MGTRSKTMSWAQGVTRTNWADDAEDDKSEAPAMDLMKEPTENPKESASAADGGSFDDVKLTRADLPANTETEVDPETGCKTVTEYKLDPKGRRCKVTKLVKVDSTTRPVRKKVLERRTWTKFGHAAKDGCKNTYSGAGYQEEGVTYYPDVIFLDLTPKAKVGKKVEEESAGQKVGSVVVCRICGMTGDHWTLKCPNKEKIASGRMVPIGIAAGGGGSSMGEGGGGMGGKYVPPSIRNSDGSRMLDTSMATRDDSNTLRVSNLSEETREGDLQELFRSFGPINRIYLAKDRETQASRGFAFVTFMRREDAQRAMDRLAGYGYDHLILQIEWAKPSAPR